MNHDLTVGNPSRVLWKFCLPLLGSMLFQQFYNIADSLVVGKFLGENALAAVGNSYEITLVLIAFAFGVNVGCSVIAGQLYGARQYADVRTAVYTTLISGGILCGLLMAVSFLYCDPLLELIRTPGHVFADSRLYLQIYIGGLPFVFYYNIATGIFSALGDSKTPFYFLAVSSVANIIADILFVTAFHMGVSGVAWATFLCQGVSCILAVAVVLRRLKFIGAGEQVRIFSGSVLYRIAVVAIPTIFQQTFISVGNVIIQGLINGFGTAVMAGYAASIKLNNLFISSMTTLGSGVSNFTAQNLGAGKNSRILQGHHSGWKLAWTLCVPLALMYFFGCGLLLRVFMKNAEGDAILEGMQFLKIVSVFYPIIAVKLISDGVLRGSGMMRQFMIGTLADMILRVVLAWILSGFWGSTGIWMAWPGSWIVGTVLSLTFVQKRFHYRSEKGNV